MTNRERLIALLGFSPNKDAVTAVLIDSGIADSGDYVPASLVALKKCAIPLMQLLLTTPDMTNETGFVIRYDREALLKVLAQYKADVGIVEGIATIKNVSYLW
jgi:hypothetical protein